MLLLLGAVTYCVLAYLANPWTRLYNKEQELDLYTGQIRVTQHRLYFQTRQEIYETPVSKSLTLSSERADDEKWVKVSTFGFATGNSPHYNNHGAFVVISQMPKYWEIGNFDEAAREKTSRQLLKVWREGESGFALGNYTEWLLAWVISRAGKPTTARDIPDDIVERCLSARDEAEREALLSQPP